MCGISGFLRARADLSAERLTALGERMATPLRHRGPDDSGVWVDPPAGFALSHRRLSILDLSPEGAQPMQSECGRFAIAYNGEVYNFLALRNELEARGRKFRGHSDTEVVLSAIAEWGVDVALERFEGMWAFAVGPGRADADLARDRAGKKPLYYARARHRVLRRMSRIASIE